MAVGQKRKEECDLCLVANSNPIKLDTVESWLLMCKSIYKNIEKQKRG